MLKNGIVIIYKEKGMSSANVVAKVKSILKRNLLCSAHTKVGHFGTLDPEAEGVLPIAIGRATRLQRYHLEEDKTYYAHFEFGYKTNTLDNEGEIIATSNILPTMSQLKDACKEITGIIMQEPPQFSAKHVNGKRAYELARKGEEVKLESRQVEISKIQVKEQLSNSKFALMITCSSGTYIRAIVRDLAQKLKTEGTMTFLRRERSGLFSMEKSMSIEAFGANLYDDNLSYEEKIAIINDRIIPLNKCIKADKLILSSGQIKQLNSGLPLFVDSGKTSTRTLVYESQTIQALARVENDGRVIVETWLR